MDHLLWKQEVDPLDIPPNCKSKVDWKDCGVLSEVRNQENCGCYWAMACVEAVEAQTRILCPREPIPLLSHQYLLDCCPSVYDFGMSQNCHDYPYSCYTAFNWWSTFGKRVYSLVEYPYVQRRNPKPSTKTDWKYPGKSIFGCKKISDERRDHIIIHLNKYPVIACMNIYTSFWNYDLGTIYEGPSEDEYNSGEFGSHALLLIGYGTDRGKNYWLVKNSWGTGWGNNGYAKVSRDVKIGGQYLLYEICFPYVVAGLRFYENSTDGMQY